VRLNVAQEIFALCKDGHATEPTDVRMTCSPRIAELQYKKHPSSDVAAPISVSFSFVSACYYTRMLSYKRGKTRWT
jgi:hypothetical protein